MLIATQLAFCKGILVKVDVSDISKSPAGFSFLIQTGVLQKLSSALFEDDIIDLVDNC
jgi:hypothetical protein